MQIAPEGLVLRVRFNPVSEQREPRTTSISPGQEKGGFHGYVASSPVKLCGRERIVGDSKLCSGGVNFSRLVRL